MPAKNVLLLIADDWSPLAKCYGNDVVHTPNIDRFASQSTVFDNAFCTTPSCAASRANILTGAYAHQHGQYGHCHGNHGFRTHEHFANRTLPAVLKAAGVRSGLIGKDHVAPAHVYPFDVNEHGSPYSQADLDKRLRSFYASSGDQPTYMHVASTYPHRSFDLNIEGDEYRETDIHFAPADVIVPDWLPDEPEVREDLAGYYTFISRFDRFVGRMLDTLDELGRADDTLVILMSDHGLPFPAAKASPYESGHHCPLIIRKPGQTKSQRCSALVNWCDIYPTITAHLGVDAKHQPEDLPGRSLLGLLDTPDAPGWDETFYAHNFHEICNAYPYRVLREKRYKFVQHLLHDAPMPLPSDLFASKTWQCVVDKKLTKMGKRSTRDVLFHPYEALYDLQADPAESVNIIDQPEHAQRVSSMRERLMKMRQETRDPWLLWDKQMAANAFVRSLPTS